MRICYYNSISMYKSIVPELVSFDTKLDFVDAITYSEDFNFYKPVKKPAKFHYKIKVDNNIYFPEVYDFKNGYFYKNKDDWYYRRDLKFFTLKLKYAEKEKTFYFNSIYSLVPFEIGHIFPVGRLIRDFIDLDLFQKGYLTILGGFTINYKGKIISIVGPSMNGKTTLLKRIIEDGGHYISEGPIIIDIKNNHVFPCSNIEKKGRKISRELYALIEKNNIRHYQKERIDKLYLIINSTNPDFDATNKDLFDFIFFRSLIFLKSPFISAYIFKNNLTKKIFDQICSLQKNISINNQFLPIKNYDYDQIFKSK